MINARRLGLLLPHVVKRRVKISPFYRFFSYRSFYKIVYPRLCCWLRNINRFRYLLLGMTGEPQIKSGLFLALFFFLQRPRQPLGNGRLFFAPPLPKNQAVDISQNFGELFGKKNYEIAAEKAGFGNKDTYRQAKTVVQNASPELVEAMDNGSIAISTAARLVDALVEVQQRARQACGQGGILLRANLPEATVG